MFKISLIALFIVYSAYKNLPLVESLTPETKQENVLKSNLHNQATSIFTAFLTLLGFDSKKVGAIAINGLIFLAQLLGTSLIRKIRESKHAEDIITQNPFDWMLENNEISKIMSHVTDPNLYEYVIEYIKERSLDEESSCIQLLICKITPFIRHMQKAVNTTIRPVSKGKPVLYQYIPERKEIREQSEMCQKKYQFCNN